MWTLTHGKVIWSINKSKSHTYSNVSNLTQHNGVVGVVTEEACKDRAASHYCVYPISHFLYIKYDHVETKDMNKNRPTIYLLSYLVSDLLVNCPDTVCLFLFFLASLDAFQFMRNCLVNSLMSRPSRTSAKVNKKKSNLIWNWSVFLKNLSLRQNKL